VKKWSGEDDKVKEGRKEDERQKVVSEKWEESRKG
jgi:hypothetical protein